MEARVGTMAPLDLCGLLVFLRIMGVADWKAVVLVALGRLRGRIDLDETSSLHHHPASGLSICSDSFSVVE
jgi:hypothetical protein